MITKTQKTPTRETIPLLNPTISIKARFVWALLRYMEQNEPDKMPTISEIALILNVQEQTLHRYLRELEREGCLSFKMQFVTFP